MSTPEYTAGLAATEQDVLDCIASAKGSTASCSLCGQSDLKVQSKDGSRMPFTMGGGNSVKTQADGDFRHYLLITCNDCGNTHWIDASIVGDYLLDT
jgi:predicted nucleic-acid-binding Zn-ribbon protein